MFPFWIDLSPAVFLQFSAGIVVALSCLLAILSTPACGR